MSCPCLNYDLWPRQQGSNAEASWHEFGRHVGINKVDRAALGLLSDKERAGYRFFRRTRNVPDAEGKIDAWEFNCLHYEDKRKELHAVFGCSDSEHCARRASANILRELHISHVCGIFVNNSISVCRGSPLKAAAKVSWSTIINRTHASARISGWLPN